MLHTIPNADLLKYILLSNVQVAQQAPPPANLPICQIRTLAEEGKESTI